MAKAKPMAERNQRTDGEPIRRLSIEHKVSYATAYEACKGWTWKDVA